VNGTKNETGINEYQFLIIKEHLCISVAKAIDNSIDIDVVSITTDTYNENNFYTLFL